MRISTTMDFLEIEFDPEAYSTVWLTQREFKKCMNLNNFAEKTNRDLNTILRNPRLYVLRQRIDTDITNDLTTLSSGCHIVKIKEAKWLDLNKVTSPFAVVVILGPCKKRNRSVLSSNDLDLLAKVKELNQLENTIYLLRETKDFGKFELNDLNAISKDIQDNIYGKMSYNTIFSKLFSISDIQIPIRLGHCLHYSIHSNIQNLYNGVAESFKGIDDDLKYLARKRQVHMKRLMKMFLKRRYGVHQDLEAICSHGTFMKYPIPETSKFFLGSILNILGNLAHRPFHEKNIKKSLNANIPKSVENICPCIKEPKLTRRKKRFLGLTAKNARRQRFVRGISESRPQNSIRAELLKKAKKLLDDCFNVVDMYFKSYNEKLLNIIKTMEVELEKGKGMITLHERKTVSGRMTKIKGFGYIDGITHVYLKEDNENDKMEVKAFFKKYFTPECLRNNPIKIEYKQRKITLFSKIEQGSKINKANDSVREKYGSLGMFLEDSNGGYFFTTCAHVIGEDELAYLPGDNSPLGRSVLVYNPDQKDCLDFSLVKVSPDRNLTCTFGLKTIKGTFIRGQIFKGDFSDIVKRPVYRWAGNEPCLQTGKCIGYEYDQDDHDEGRQFHFLQIDNNNFAKPGDSGALICIGEDPESGLAAFVLVGGSTDVKSGVDTYLVYKVSDALEKVSLIRKDVKPCLHPQTVSIPIASSGSGSNKNQKRKRIDI